MSENEIEIIDFNQYETYKILTVNKVNDEKWLFSITEGVKNKKLTISLNRKELAYLIMELERIYNKSI